MIRVYYGKDEFPVVIDEDNELNCIGYCMQCSHFSNEYKTTQDCISALTNIPYIDFNSWEEYNDWHTKYYETGEV